MVIELQSYKDFQNLHGFTKASHLHNQGYFYLIDSCFITYLWHGKTLMITGHVTIKHTCQLQPDDEVRKACCSRRTKMKLKPTCQCGEVLFVQAQLKAFVSCDERDTTHLKGFVEPQDRAGRHVADPVQVPGDQVGLVEPAAEDVVRLVPHAGQQGVVVCGVTRAA